mgnify:CR=1 FL=1
MNRALLAMALCSTALPAFADEVNIYSHRQPELIQPLLDAFTAETGITTNIAFVDKGMVERLVAEGDRSPADLVLTVDIARLTQVVDAGVTQAVESEVLAANIRDVPIRSGWSTLEAASLGVQADYPYRVFAGDLTGDYLVVGLSNADLDNLADIILTGFGWSALAVLIAAIAAGTWIASRLQRRLSEVTATLHRVASGDLSTRLAMSGRGDDLDLISGEINLTLGRLGALVEAILAAFPALPAIAGVTLRVAKARYKNWDRCDLTYVELDAGTAVAGVTTQSKCPSPEVEWCRDAIPMGQARAVVVNAGNANAFTGHRGRAAVEAIAAKVANHLSCQPSDIFVSSTGVIGVPLPIDKAEAGLEAAFVAAPCGWEDAANTIGTTDTYAKGAHVSAMIGDTRVDLVGIIKGSGMIAPDMATMLGYIFTDAAIDPALLQQMLSAANKRTFSCITVDSDTSTSDTVLAFATGKAGNAPLASMDDAGADAFAAALSDLCRQLAHLVVRDGEGASKFIEITVEGAESDASAHRIALSIANSPLVKTAIAGEDANWGRVVMAVGKAGEPAERDNLAIRFGATQVAAGGLALDGYDEAPVAAHLKGQDIVIGVDIGLGEGRATVWTCDLTHGYISINADYRS